jgi:hypothetical protein
MAVPVTPFETCGGWAARTGRYRSGHGGTARAHPGCRRLCRDGRNGGPSPPITRLDHCLVGTEPGIAGCCPPGAAARLGMRLGEGSGATLAIAVVKAAAACHAGMATFAEAGVSGPA